MKSLRNLVNFNRNLADIVTERGVYVGNRSVEFVHCKFNRAP